MAYILVVVLACVVLAYVITAYIVTAYAVTACMVMAYVVMAYIVNGLYSSGLNSYGLHSYGLAHAPIESDVPARMIGRGSPVACTDMRARAGRSHRPCRRSSARRCRSRPTLSSALAAPARRCPPRPAPKPKHRPQPPIALCPMGLCLSKVVKATSVAPLAAQRMPPRKKKQKNACTQKGDSDRRIWTARIKELSSQPRGHHSLLSN